jgi:hypothetical protein
VVVGHGLADDFGGLDVLAIGEHAEFLHRVQQASLAGLEPVADIGQGPVHDRAHRVREITVLQFTLDLQVQHPAQPDRRATATISACAARTASTRRAVGVTGRVR